MWEAHNWTRFDRLWIGLFTLIPVTVGFTLILTALSAASGPGEDGGPCMICVLYPLLVVMLLVAYAPAVFNNRRIGKWFRRLWLVGFLLAGPVTLPMYWYRHIWLAPYEPDEEEAVA